jgi:prevent-host-death family protein
MHMLNIHKAKTQFSKIVEWAINGEETIIAKSGKPVAKLVPISPEKPRRPLGVLKGKIKIADDFDDPLPDDILSSFEGHL